MIKEYATSADLDGSIDGRNGYCAWPGSHWPGVQSRAILTGTATGNPSSLFTADRYHGERLRVEGASQTTTNQVVSLRTTWWDAEAQSAVVSYHSRFFPNSLSPLLLFENASGGFNPTEEPFHHNLLGTAGPSLPDTEPSPTRVPFITGLANSGGNRDFFYFGHANRSSLGTPGNCYDLPAANLLLGNNTIPWLPRTCTRIGSCS